jgi:hypothetical protein
LCLKAYFEPIAAIEAGFAAFGVIALKKTDVLKRLF